jgi:hypothetical protein
MRITTKRQANVLVWGIGLVLWSGILVDFLTDAEIISAIVGLVCIGSLGLFEVVHRSKLGQQVSSYLPPKLLPENRFLRWTLLLIGGIVTVGWILEIGEFLLTG